MATQKKTVRLNNSQPALVRALTESLRLYLGDELFEGLDPEIRKKIICDSAIAAMSVLGLGVGMIRTDNPEICGLLIDADEVLVEAYHRAMIPRPATRASP